MSVTIEMSTETDEVTLYNGQGLTLDLMGKFENGRIPQGDCITVENKDGHAVIIADCPVEILSEKEYGDKYGF